MPGTVFNPQEEHTDLSFLDSEEEDIFYLVGNHLLHCIENICVVLYTSGGLILQSVSHPMVLS